MDCNEIRPLLDAHVDGELDLVRQVAIEHHLAGCPDCAKRVAAARERKTAIRNTLAPYKAPGDLVRTIRGSIASQPAPTDSAAKPVDARSVSGSTKANRGGTIWSFPRLLPQLGGMAAALLVAVGLGYSWGTARAQRNRLVEAAIADHVRSLQPNHLLDVVSTDQHTVKPWFAGKVEFSPPVVDLATQGFPLVGGRLEHLDAHTVAALVYHRRKHVINLFVWPADRDTVAVRPTEHDGYNVRAWTTRDLNFLAVSEIPAPELEEFAAAFRAAVPQP